MLIQRNYLAQFISPLALLGAFVSILATAAPASETNAPPSTKVSDPLLDLFIKKGYVTQQEAEQVRAEAEAMQSTNTLPTSSKWKFGGNIKDVELYGDLRFRYEERSVHTSLGDRFELDRLRYALRLGLRGDLRSDFYYGLRLETSSNPRSPWVTFGTSSSGVPYNGPSGKSTAGINLGQLYLGWKPSSWFDATVGKMPQPLYVTPMLWDTDINPEGLVERFKYPIGPADFFANFGQFIYQDVNPDRSTPFLSTPTDLNGRDTSGIFLLSWQGGVTYHFNKDTFLKAAGTIYNYTGQGPTNSPAGFGNAFVGASTITPGSPVVGSSGYPGGRNDGFIFNQTGINDLLVLDFPFELDFKLAHQRVKVFGDFAENLDGSQRAAAATASGGSALLNNSGGYSVTIPYQPKDNRAYQAGVAIGGGEDLGLVYGGGSREPSLRRNSWEFRAYWQHVEQYALDPNLIDSDFFEGRGNMEGVYSAFAYGFTDAVIATIRFGYATRINPNLGTGGSNQDIPQVNPLKNYELIQLDLTMRF
ncbi:MAG TPA: putative porin [Candidatus Saccharimonadales bacterium]|nr:putative porin [Candidatus Saccharimonadales bacterium]